jgi:hypothetical protein
MSNLSGQRTDTDQYLVAAKVRDRLAASRRTTQHFDMERFNLKKPNEGEGNEESNISLEGTEVFEAEEKKSPSREVSSPGKKSEIRKICVVSGTKSW